MKKLALTPPMGWNSWDCYGASVTEKEVRQNADYMAKHLKRYGWEYIVVDIQWYEPTANSSAYHPFVPLQMDEYSRLIPAANRFPSAVKGKGFQPLAEYVHRLGLKFGIHIMRGVPRQAVHANTPILGTTVGAREIAQECSICAWNTDMYGVDPSKPGAQEYYNSLFLLYALWGIDYVKVDDIAFNFIAKEKYCAGEIELIRNAIDHCGRDVVLSLSPGPAPIDKAEHLKANANMWRMTDDLWDIWRLVEIEFDRCKEWSTHVGEGYWPDADMLPLGHISLRGCQHGMTDRWTNLTRPEQRTMMTLWCIFRSPLMFGGELTDNDGWTNSLLTNEEVLKVLNHSSGAHQVYRRDDIVLWQAQGESCTYAAVFNLSDYAKTASVSLRDINITGVCNIRDLWERKDLPDAEDTVSVQLDQHGSRLYRFIQI